MSKPLLLVGALLLFTYSKLFAQHSESSDYIVLDNGDILHGRVVYINDQAVNPKFHKKVRLTGTNGKTKKYKRQSISSFRVDGNEYRSFWLHQPPPAFPRISLVNPQYSIDSDLGQHYFLKVVSTGYLSHYELEWLEQGDSQLYSMALLKKAADPYFIRADQGIIKLKKRYSSDTLWTAPSSQRR
ncbi:MAG: hypothetical protein AAGA85_20935 [Bacteroidota bacterium]